MQTQRRNNLAQRLGLEENKDYPLSISSFNNSPQEKKNPEKENAERPDGHGNLPANEQSMQYRNWSNTKPSPDSLFQETKAHQITNIQGLEESCRNTLLIFIFSLFEQWQTQEIPHRLQSKSFERRYIISQNPVDILYI